MNVRIERDGALVLLPLARSDSRNALNDAMAGAVVDAANQVNADLSITCAVLTGDGP